MTDIHFQRLSRRNVNVKKKKEKHKTKPSKKHLTITEPKLVLFNWRKA